MNKQTMGRLALFGVILILVLVMIISGLRILESTVFIPSAQLEESTGYVSRTIEQDGKSYFPRKDITTILIMGIDERGPVQASDSYRNYGEADMVAVMILDQTQEKIRILSLNRDTMVQMPVLGLNGKTAGSFYGQLALSHTYGSGLEDSCENVRNTVSSLLGGIDIDYYLALQMDAVKVLNDAVGGVSVTVKDDFGLVDPTITKGSLTLTGEQALTYVQHRMDVGDQLNISRMERQAEYMQAFAGALTRAVQGNTAFVTDTYEQVQPYLVTDCSSTVLNSLFTRCSGNELEQVVSLEGENRKGREYYEFYADEAALQELILNMFYAEKQ